MLTDYLINSLFYGLHKDGLIDITLKNATTTTELSLLTGKKIYDYFDEDMPCDVVVSTLDPAPTITFAELPDESMIYASAALDFMCYANNQTAEVSQTFTLLTSFEVSYTLEMGENANITGNADKINLSLDGTQDSTIGKIGLTKAKLALPVIERVVKSAVNKILNKGLSLENALSHLGITFINVSEAALALGTDYLQLSVTPIFDLSE